jgi:hypothetical protein
MAEVKRAYAMVKTFNLQEIDSLNNLQEYAHAHQKRIIKTLIFQMPKES